MTDKIALTTDAVVFAHKNQDIVVLLIRRKNPPYQGRWALPGGFLEAGETLEDGCVRELKEETGLEVNLLKRIGIYDQIDRDPRGRMISVAFTTVLDAPETVKGSDDASHAQWIALKNLENLAFDHDRIIREAAKQMNSLEKD